MDAVSYLVLCYGSRILSLIFNNIIQTNPITYVLKAAGAAAEHDVNNASTVRRIRTNEDCFDIW